MLEDGLSIMLRVKKEPCIQQQNKDIYIYIYIYIILGIVDYDNKGWSEGQCPCTLTFRIML